MQDHLWVVEVQNRKGEYVRAKVFDHRSKAREFAAAARPNPARVRKFIAA